jgi:hypothetical protein
MLYIQSGKILYAHNFKENMHMGRSRRPSSTATLAIRVCTWFVQGIIMVIVSCYNFVCGPQKQDLNAQGWIRKVGLVKGETGHLNASRSLPTGINFRTLQSSVTLR